MFRIVSSFAGRFDKAVPILKFAYHAAMRHANDSRRSSIGAAPGSASLLICIVILIFVSFWECTGGALKSSPTSISERATFAGGCFWCMFTPFEELPGVISVTAGYTGGHLVNPTYGQVATGESGHAESVEVVFDPSRISYQTLLETFWHNIDPLQEDVQFCAFGSEYRTSIFFHGEKQRQQALASKHAVEAQLRRRVFTEITSAGRFYKAEEEHQHYNRKHPDDYEQWRISCHRQERLRSLWGPKY